MADDFDPHNARQPDRPKRNAGTQTGKRAIRAIFATASRAADDELAPPDPDPNEPRDGIRPGQWPGAPHDALPPDCPVQVIGTDVRGTVYCRTARGLLRAVEKWDMPALVDLFAPRVNYLFWAWPAFGKKKIWDAEQEKMIEELRVVRVERDKAMTALMNAAAKKPLFDPGSQHRGRGGWRDRQNRFIWHSGAWLWMAERGRLERARPAEHDGFLYTRNAATIEPWDAPVSHDESPAQRILDYLVRWNWERPYLDPLLTLGWLATSLMGGALGTIDGIKIGARPVLFTSGGFGVGKSTLKELLRSVLAGTVISLADTTAAHIYQRMGQDCLPVMVDELEAKAGSGKASAIIDLARIAYTGDEMGRGGSDHVPVGFSLRMAFAFYAINPPAMTEADRSRMAMLNLAPIEAKKLDMVVKDVDGRMLLRQVMDGFGDFHARILPDWWSALQMQGLDSRAIDTYGTLLAAAELLVGPERMEAIGLPVTDAHHLGEIVAAATHLERAERLDNWHKCLNHLLDCAIDAWRDGAKPTIGGIMDGLANTGLPYDQGGLELGDAQKRLQLVNCSAGKPLEKGKGFLLAVPRDGPALKKLYDGTEWERGGWWQALKQAPKDIVIRDAGARQTVKINGKATHCVLVDMGAFAAFTDREGG